MTATALVTGAARRIGAEIARRLHDQGYNLILHYRGSHREAKSLQAELNQSRPNSCQLMCADLADLASVDRALAELGSCRDAIQLLVNNASSFYPTSIDHFSHDQWDDLFASNCKGPYYLSCKLAPELRKNGGSIINIADIHGQSPLKNYPVYSMAKAANRMMTKALARELAPKVRVNGIAPGAILWPENDAQLGSEEQQKMLAQIPLARLGQAGEIADTVLFLAQRASYITGQVITVDGGRRLTV